MDDIVPWHTRGWERVQDVIAAVREWFSERTFGEAMAMIGALIVFGAFSRIWRSMRIHRAGAKLDFSYHAPEQALQQMAQAFEIRMRSKGMDCPGHRTWQEHLQALQALQPERAAEIPVGAEEFVQLYNAVRFGAASGAAPALERLGELLRNMEVRK
jgi:hypothetical protein